MPIFSGRSTRACVRMACPSTVTHPRSRRRPPRSWAKRRASPSLGSNWCLVHALVDEENARLVAFAALDNLVKGAAGSALQNFNARFGYPETMGLEALPLWP